MPKRIAAKLQPLTRFTKGLFLSHINSYCVIFLSPYRLSSQEVAITIRWTENSSILILQRRVLGTYEMLLTRLKMLTLIQMSSIGYDGMKRHPIYRKERSDIIYH